MVKQRKNCIEKYKDNLLRKHGWWVDMFLFIMFSSSRLSTRTVVFSGKKAHFLQTSRFCGLFCVQRYRNIIIPDLLAHYFVDFNNSLSVWRGMQSKKACISKIKSIFAPVYKKVPRRYILYRYAYKCTVNCRYNRFVCSKLQVLKVSVLYTAGTTC